MIEMRNFIKSHAPDGTTQYQNFIIDWIVNLGTRNISSFNYDNIKDIAIGIYLLSKDLKIDPVNETDVFIRYFTNKYGYGNLIKKIIIDITEKNPDLIDLLSEIHDKTYENVYINITEFKKHIIETLYNNEYLSIEENRETLIFGDNILDDELSIRQLSDIMRTMTKEYVKEYISHLNLGDITFTISDSSIMYLKDTDGILLAMVTMKDETPRHIIRYTNENGSALFLLFEPALIKTETIYGLSLDCTIEEERGLLILEKEKDDSVYRFLFGRSEL